MSPEQCRGDDVIDARSDIYSLGIVAFEMLTGKVPFNAPTPTSLAIKHIMDSPPPLRSLVSEIPENIERAVLRALQKEPASRYRCAGDFAAELANAVRTAKSGATQVLTGANNLSKGEARGATRPLFDPSSSGETDIATNTDLSSPSGNPQTELMDRANTTTAGKVDTGEKTLIRSHNKTELHSATKSKTEEHVIPVISVSNSVRRYTFYWYLAAALLVVGLSIGGYFYFDRNTGNRPAPPGSQEIVPSLPNMVLIQGGWLKMGSLDGYDDEKPVHDVWIDSFYMDQTEVTNEDFEKFVNAANYVTDAEKGNDEITWRSYYTPERRKHPVVYVSWNDAAEYAKWVGKRLPTEAEWEYASRGGLLGKKYPWGDEPPDRRANFGQGGVYEPPNIPTQAVKSYDHNGYGLYDMAGNVYEWCNDWYDNNYYKNSPERNPRGPSTGSNRVLRGGSWYSDFNQIRIGFRSNSEPPDGVDPDRGFRCAKSK
jgi:formylglycine-generating enzyme required for sulfatase activity